MKNIIFPLLVSLTLLSCTGLVYQKHVKMENLAWNRFKPVIFEVPIKNTGTSYDFLLAIRHHTDIPYSEIKTEVYLTTPGGETRSRYVTVRLKDNQGNNLGDGLGELWDVQAVVWEDLNFSSPGTCTVEVNSAMPQLDVVGIIEVGLVVK